MIWVLIYVLALLSPILLMVVMNALENARTKNSVRLSHAIDCRPAPRMPRLELPNSTVALEAQFLVSPNLAIREAEELLDLLYGGSARPFPPPNESLEPRARFEALLLRIEVALRTSGQPA